MCNSIGPTFCFMEYPDINYNNFICICPEHLLIFKMAKLLRIIDNNCMAIIYV